MSDKRRCTAVRVGLWGLLAVVLPATVAGAGMGFTAPAALNANAASDTGGDQFPQVTTDGAGHWVAVWQSTDSLGGTLGTDSDILIARSVDSGATWTAPQALNTNAASDAGNDNDPRVTTDGAGRWVAVWDSKDSLGGTLGTDRDILVARSTNDGATWTAPEALNTDAASDTTDEALPQVTTDGAGHWVAVWESLDTLSGPSCDILVARSTDDGATWTDPDAISTASDTRQDGKSHLATDGAGHWVVVWDSRDPLGGTLGTDRDILVARSADDGATWTVPQAVDADAASDTGHDNFPHVTTDGAGHWVAVWQSGDSQVLVHDERLGDIFVTEADILVSRSTDNGATWTAPQAIDANAASDTADEGSAQVTTDGAGHWVAVWTSVDLLGGALGTDYDILVARSADDGATWTAPQALNTNAASDAGNDLFPQVTTDGAEHWVTVWDSADTLDSTIGTDADILRAYMDRAMDTDGDGLADAGETDTGTYVDDWDTGTDPASADTDGDALPDGWEVDYNLDPFTDDADQDLDGDGFTNGSEYAAGTDPGDPDSTPSATELPVGGPASLALAAAALAALACCGRRR